MSSRFNPQPYADAFAQAEAYLAKGKSKLGRPVASNTRLARVDEDTIALVLHSTAVVTYHRDGTFTIYGGGWNTVTTKARIREFSPAHPSSDGSGGWVVGHTGEFTPPRVQKCRSCKGRGRWQETDYCYGPSSWGPGVCRGGSTVYDVPVGQDGWFESRREVPCEHGQQDRHATEPCSHGEWKRHETGESERVCYRCKGEGRTDYGSNPIPITVDASTPYDVDAEGRYIGVTDLPYAPAKPSSGKSHTSYYVAPAYTPPAHHIGGGLVDDLARLIPDVKAEVRHPVNFTMHPLNIVIVSLNDAHGWSRERIADWLDTLDLDLRFPVPA